MVRIIELFAGVGSQIQALKNLGIECEPVAICEIDKYAIEAYKKLHGEVLNLGDVSKVNSTDIPDCDLLTYSFPCQDISVAGAQMGLDEGSNTRSSLLWECAKIIENKKPKYLLMENVKNLVGRTHLKNFEKWLQLLENYGYKNYWKILNGNHFNVPQNRERVFCVSILGNEDFSFEEGALTSLTIRDILENEDDVPENMYMDDKPYIPREKPSSSESNLIHVGDLDFKATESIKRVYSIDGICPTLTTMQGGHRQPKILLDCGRIRKLTPRECWKLMGFTDEQFDKVKDLSNAQLYKLAGNSICVPCLESIFRQLFLNKEKSL